MKPNFAINITDTALELLHRTSRGWMLVGDAAFDNPDLDEAISYLRASALGLSPHGITTKLIIPPSQVLYTEVYAPGSDIAARRAAVAAALEGMTPYDVEDLVFDFRGTGATVKVAAVARETLQEAEAFARAHRLNPVSFVTTPGNGQFAGEPWFGQTEMAGKILPEGEKVTRDQDPVNIISRDLQAEEAATAAKAEAEKAAALQAEKARADEAAKAEAEAERALAAQRQQAAEAAEKAAREAALADEARKAAAENAKAAVQEPAEPETSAPLAARQDPEATAARLKLMEAEARAILQANSEAIRKTADAEKARAAREKAGAPDDSAAPASTAEPALKAGKAEAKADAAAAAPLQFSSRRRDAPPPPAPGAAKQQDTAAAVDAPAIAAAGKSEDAIPAKAPVLTPAAPMGPTPRLAGAAPPKSPAPKPPVIDKIIATRAPIAEVGDKIISPAPAPVEKPPLAAAAKGGLAAMVTATGIPGRSGAPKRGKSRNVADVAHPPRGRGRGKPVVSHDDLGEFGKKLEMKRGKPRFLGVFLVLVLLILMALVAAWSSYIVTSKNSSDTPVVAEGAAFPDLPDTQNPELLADMSRDAIDDAAVTGHAPEIAAPEAVAIPVIPVETVADPMPAEAAPAAAVPADTTQAEAEPASTQEPAPASQIATSEPDPAPAEAGIQVAQPEIIPPATTQERSPPAADRQDEIFLASTDGPPPVFDPVSLPALSVRPDAPPGNVVPPPPYGTFYEFDADGLIKPTPQGVITPEGVRLVAARPAILPPPRPAAISPPTQEAAPQAPAAAGAAAIVTEPDAAGSARPDSAIASVFAPDPEFSAPRPRPRPADASPARAGEDDASVAIRDGATRLTGQRPLARPQSVIARAAEAQSQARAASLVASAVAVAEPDRSDASLLAVSYSPRPAARPRDFSAAVAAAVASASRNAPPQETDEQLEPEVQASASAAPRIPTRASVAKQATFSNAINLSKTNLIGIYGTANNRYALIRSSSGSFKKVKVGDKVDGGTVAAITGNELRYKKGSKLLTLTMPKG